MTRLDGGGTAPPVGETGGAALGGGDVVVDWGRRDVFVVTSWKKVRHEAEDGSVMFSSDRPLQEALHLFREDRGNA